MTKCSLILISLMSMIFIYGCTSDTDYVPPTKVESAPSEVEIPTPSEIEEIKSQETVKPKITELKVGETATDNQLKITVNGVDFKKVIDYEATFSTIPFEAEEGNEFVVIDLTIENILDDKTQTPVLTTQSSVMDQDGYNYLYDTASIAVDKIYDNKDILPGMKKRGKVVYSVPEDATDLKFLFKFDIFQAKTVVFDIK